MTAHSVGGLLLGHESRLQILLIEDSTSDSEVVLSLFEEELPQTHVHLVSTLQDAMARLGERRFDAVLADLSLPDADGVSVVRAVRDAHPDTALLVLTGRAEGQLALWALAVGAQDYLVKGQYDGPRLVTAVLHALRRQRTEREVHSYLQLARGMLDALEAPTCAVGPDGEIRAINEAWRAFAASNGGLREGTCEGSNYLMACDQVPGVSLDAAAAADVAAGLRNVLAGRQERYQYEYPCHSPDRDRWYVVRIAPAEIDRARGAVITHVDVTAMHEVQQELTHQALHDTLTGLPNRVLLADRLGQALLDAERRGRRVGVAFLDLDHFKRVNDSLGHAAGDTLLVQVAERLRRQMRPGDTLCRYSGDEFVVVWRDLATDEAARGVSQRLTAAFEEPFDLLGASVNVSASVGVVVGRPSQSTEDLLLAADAAMYEAKRRGRGGVRVFTNELRKGVEELIATEVALREALARAELVLHYQPVIDLATGHPVALEALARWQHPTRGLLGPDHFIGVAESSGLMVPLGRWALRQACKDAVALTEPGRMLDVAVNLSARQLTGPDVVTHVREALASTGLDPRRLVLEVTESAFMADEEAAAHALTDLSALGVRIALDDFGTGYSSLLYLRRYPISMLKLDRTFVSGMSDSANDGAICASVVSLAHAVDATSVAEGVETLEQCATLRGFGCEQAQGFLWSPAVPLVELPEVLAACREVPVPPRRPLAPSMVPPIPPDVAARIAALHSSGASLHTIASALNRAAAPDPAGMRWTAGSIAPYVAA